MLTIDRIIHNFTYPAAMRPLFFDIETTGFDRNRTILYMIGCIYPEGDNGHFVQWFNDDGVSEKEILQAFGQLLAREDWTLVTFNGESFDIPYLVHHGRLNDMDLPMEDMASLDLYRIMRPFQQLYRLRHGGQKYWERFLGIYREDIYNGGELIDVYRSYLHRKEEKDLHDLLLHNGEDLLGMTRLMALLPYHDLMEGRYDLRDIEIIDLDQADLYASSPYRDQTEMSEEENLPADPGTGEAGIRVPCVHFQGQLEKDLPRPLEIGRGQGLFSGRDRDIHLYIPILTGEMKHFYKKYRNYYYLPQEDRAIHKSVGQFVDSDHRQQAKAVNCYMKETGLFLPLPVAKKHYGFQIEASASYGTLPRFRRDYESDQEYIQCQKLLFRQDAILADYVHDMSQHIFMDYLEYVNGSQAGSEPDQEAADCNESGQTLEKTGRNQSSELREDGRKEKLADKRLEN